jgi:hypothetical protein
MSIASGVESLPAFTSDQWLTVFYKDNDQMARRWLNVMHQMDGHYRQENLFVFNRSLAHTPTPLGACYYYWTSQFELALRIAYHVNAGRHQIASVGFLGNIAPADALDLIVDRAIIHLIERSLTTAFCLCPKNMEFAPLLQLYDLVPSHPRVKVTLEAETAHFRKWTLEAVELL